MFRNSYGVKDCWYGGGRKDVGGSEGIKDKEKSVGIGVREKAKIKMGVYVWGKRQRCGL